MAARGELPPMRHQLRSAVIGTLLLGLIASACGSTGSTSASTVRQESQKRADGMPKLADVPDHAYLSGTLHSDGGQFLTDGLGRTVQMHGVNAVYKLAPYRMTVTPGQVNTLNDADAVRMQRLGFNVVRLGVLWEGIEPGTGGPNQSGICTSGPASDPHMWNASVASSYLDEVAKVVAALGRHHIYALIDMHQDVWNQLFSGEGMPQWATCTDGNPITVYPGRWSANYSNPAVVSSFNHLFDNDVVGDLQGEYQRSWSAIAKRFAQNPWVVGYDPINEPADYSPTVIHQRWYSPRLSCMYAGSSGAAREIGHPAALPCPVGSPKTGVIQAIEKADHHHLVFPEVDNAAHGHHAYLLGVINLPRIVFNFHDYCAQRSGVTGNPTDLEACSSSELAAMVRRTQERDQMGSTRTPQGPAMFMTEFGATSSEALASLLAMDTTTLGLGWMWWSWRYYDDPTGSSAEALIDDQQQLSPSATAIATTYPVAIAGTPLSSVLDPVDGQYALTYLPNTKIDAPTTIYVSQSAYPHGYCSIVDGGEITSRPGSGLLTVSSQPGAKVTVVRIVPRACVGKTSATSSS